MKFDIHNIRMRNQEIDNKYIYDHIIIIYLNTHHKALIAFCIYKSVFYTL